MNTLMRYLGDWGWGEGKRICTEDVEPPIKGGGTDPG